MVKAYIEDDEAAFKSIGNSAPLISSVAPFAVGLMFAVVFLLVSLLCCLFDSCCYKALCRPPCCRPKTSAFLQYGPDGEEYEP